ncbi:hypothetical protein [Pseudomonas sp. CFBP 13602]|uniref:hypothetical protein n=1 Tax=Pseudomonas sp. CFBP 13602 TaxID=2774039 RepID=UPI001785AF65|nr:hypothetical protein [Pseudomonas sp. CFBP 13602]MBD8826624.1 hypothetical protein [Pseudomonas sp. CFBP 13602]
MKVTSILPDEKVSARSISIEIKVRDYLELAKKIFKNNQFQRKRVRGSKTVYSLLKADIITGCVIPPLVLAYTKPDGDLEQNLKLAIETESDYFIILDGLQRSHTLMDIELETANNPEVQERFLERTIRCEIYEGINRLGILYRMLTLNTGQTAMSLRHQIEIMYLDYLKADLNGVTLIKESDNKKNIDSNEYKFKDMIEGFNSYIERSESPLDRGDILENISSLENLAKENKDHDLFKEFVTSWDAFIQKVSSLKLEIELDNDDYEEISEKSRMWATNGTDAFKRAQALSGFGAAIGLLRDDGIETSFTELNIDNIKSGADGEDFIRSFNESIDLINSRAKRIGNAQRLFFRQFFKMLFWPQSGTYLDLQKSQDEAYKSSVRIGI